MTRSTQASVLPGRIGLLVRPLRPPLHPP